MKHVSILLIDLTMQLNIVIIHSHGQRSWQQWLLTFPTPLGPQKTTGRRLSVLMMLGSEWEFVYTMIDGVQDELLCRWLPWCLCGKKTDEKTKKACWLPIRDYHHRCDSDVFYARRTIAILYARERSTYPYRTDILTVNTDRRSSLTRSEAIDACHLPDSKRKEGSIRDLQQPSIHTLWIDYGWRQDTFILYTKGPEKAIEQQE
jgi:hypothetical protein